MRIISGKHKGRRIEIVGKDNGSIRPTSDFAREAIFNILMHGKHGLNGESFIDKDVLDVYCGTGAFGLEALSRGARHVTFIDKSREAMATVLHNAERFHESDAIDTILADATKLTRARRPYALVFLDPPYFSKLIEPTLASLLAGGWVAEDGLVIIEHDAKEVVKVPEPFTVIDERRYGRAMLQLLKTH